MLRAEQWMMIGVVGIGAYAIWRLTRAKPDAANETPILQPGGPPGTVPAGVRVPNIIGQNTQPGHALLRRGARVLGRLELGGATPAAAVQALQNAGFTNVRLLSPVDVQADPGLVPLPDALLTPGPQTRWFWATWDHPTAASANVVLPREVVLLWYTATNDPGPRPMALTGHWAPVWGSFGPVFGPILAPVRPVTGGWAPRSIG